MRWLNLFKKKKYLNCPYMQHSLHFFHNEIRACCSSAKGPVFYSNYNGEEVDWNEVFEKRKQYIKEINSPFNDNPIPKECENCFMLDGFLSDKKVKKLKNKVDTLFIQNNMSCNAKCVYCVFAYKERGEQYQIVPLLKSLIDNNLLDRNSKIMLSGGEITISSDFEEMFGLLTENVDSQLILSTSGIKYSEAVENAFKQNKCWQTISLDCGTKETYYKLKQVDCFEKVIDNLKKYIEIAPSAKDSMSIKYILVDNVNDNVEEIEKFFKIISELGICHVQLDVNFEEYNCNNKKPVPKHYFDLIEKFNELAKIHNIKVCDSEQTSKILKN